MFYVKIVIWFKILFKIYNIALLKIKMRVEINKNLIDKDKSFR